jgi:hypothetical protein
VKSSIFRSSDSPRAIPTLAAAIIVLITVAQLFAFERFHEVLLSQYTGAFSVSGAEIAAVMIVIVEVLAVPYLLPLRLSAWMSWLSRISGWGMVVFWSILSVVGLIKGDIYTALFGAAVSLPGGWWPLLLIIALGVLLSWASMLREKGRLS